MSEIVSTSSESPFDGLMGEDGRWSARDLQSPAGYVEWRKFKDAIERAFQAIANVEGVSAAQGHIGGAAKSSPQPNGGHREVEDYSLTRYGAYMVSMNGDPRKPEIAAAQSYFAVRTREGALK